MAWEGGIDQEYKYNIYQREEFAIMDKRVQVYHRERRASREGEKMAQQLIVVFNWRGQAAAVHGSSDHGVLGGGALGAGG